MKIEDVLAGFDSAFLEELRQRNDIVSVIGDYVALRKAGSSYKGLCPFHSEKTPSFNVRQDRQMFYCFGCQTGGDVFTFLSEINGYSFVQSVRHLADRVGMEVPAWTKGRRGPSAEERKMARNKKDELFAINQLALNYYKGQLFSLGGQRAVAYLKKRNLDKESIARFDLGFAQDGWDGLLQELEQHRVNLNFAEELGLIVKRSSQQGYYDRFRNRLMFPIKSIAGDVIGFSGRTLSDDKDVAKYLNSPESEIYHKGSSVYGMFEARKAMRETERVILVEGNVDMVKLAQASFKEVVAPLGTALTVEQCRLLRRFVPKVLALYDGDHAGQSAAYKAAELAISEGMSFSIASLPEGEDPDSYLDREGPEALQELLDEAIPAWEFILEKAFSETDAMASAQGKTEVVRKLAPLLSGMQDRTERRFLTQQLSKMLGIEFRAVEGLIRKGQAPTYGRDQREIPPRAHAVASSFTLGDLKLLEVILLAPETRLLYLGKDVERFLSSDSVKEIADIIANSESELSETLALIPSSAVKKGLLDRLSKTPSLDNGVSVFENMLKTLECDAIERQLSQLRQDERLAGLRGDDEQLLQLVVEKAQLERQREKLLGSLGNR